MTKPSKRYKVQKTKFRESLEHDVDVLNRVKQKHHDKSYYRLLRQEETDDYEYGEEKDEY